jgi:AcrR family transcriptional regulator
MQVKKEDIKKRIMKSAQKEFLEHGYASASLRVIAEKEGLTKGVVYSYFKSKDALFCALAAPAVRFIENEFESNKNCWALKTDGSKAAYSYEESIQGFRTHAHAVLDHYESFKLLLFCAAGSSLKDYKERIIRLYAENFHMHHPAFLRTECERSTAGEMFIHTLAATYVSFLEELVLHEPDRKEADDYAVQMAAFGYPGFEKMGFCKTKGKDKVRAG